MERGKRMKWKKNQCNWNATAAHKLKEITKVNIKNAPRRIQQI